MKIKPKPKLKKTNGKGVTPAVPTPLAPVPAPTPTPVEVKSSAIKISAPEDQQEILAVDSEMRSLKDALSGIVVQLEMGESRKRELVSKLVSADNRLTTSVKKMADKYGVKLGENAQWNFEVGTMTFSQR